MWPPRAARATRWPEKIRWLVSAGWSTIWLVVTSASMPWPYCWRGLPCSIPMAVKGIWPSASCVCCMPPAFVMIQPVCSGRPATRPDSDSVLPWKARSRPARPWRAGPGLGAPVIRRGKLLPLWAPGCGWSCSYCWNGSHGPRPWRPCSSGKACCCSIRPSKPTEPGGGACAGPTGSVCP